MKIICIGRNYVDHIHELQNEIPESMVIFIKPNTAIHNINEPWVIPDFSEEIHFECEIILKICKNGHSIQPEFAETFFQEIGLGIDFTARDIQAKLKEKGLPWERAKAFDHSAIVGKFLPKHEFDLSQIHFQLEKNGEIVQNGNSHFMIHSFNSIICEVSKFFTLEIGDLIYTGTPAGVGKISSNDVLKGFLEGTEVFNLQIK